MKEEASKKHNISRRDFLKGASLSVAAGILSGCKPKDAPDNAANNNVAGSADNMSGSISYSFETPPAPIAESDISETVTADVVVIGAGVAGLMAAQAAVDAGVSTILIEKTETYQARGGHNAALSSKLQMENGISYDKAKVIRDLVKWFGGKVDQRLLWLWANNVDAVIDDMINLAEANDQPVILWGNDFPDNYYAEHKVVHMFGGMDEKIIAGLIEKDVLSKGGEIRYETPAAQLEKDDSGRVTAVIAETNDGYVRFAANKGIVLATGDYGSDPEMVSKYCPKAADVDINVYVPAVNTGDGHKMGMWVGGMMQEECPASPVMHNLGGLMMTSNPWLRVNALGERYENEDVPIPCMASKLQLLPNNDAWMIFDSTYPDDIPNVVPGFGRTSEYTDDTQAGVDAEVGKSVSKADSIEALAEMIGVPADAFAATIARYNELADGGEDLDFGKTPACLNKVDTAPFYAAKIPLALLVVLGGLNTNTELQVLDSNSEPIPGLYAAGNVVGNFFANDYPVIVPGLSHSRALVFGRLAGQNAAKA